MNFPNKRIFKKTNFTSIRSYQIIHHKMSIITICLLFCFLHGGLAYSCLTDEGKAVDWYIVYKFPKYTNYAYLLPDKQTWTKSTKKLDMSSSMVARTIQQAYNGTRDISTMSIFYNDEHPSTRDALRFQPLSQLSSESGHMKGVLTFKRKGDGFWLIHSVPKFPGNSSYSYPSSGVRYGQTMMCITYNYTKLKDLASLILIGRPSVYRHDIPRAFISDFPQLADLIKPPISRIQQRVVSLTSKGGLNVQHFMKSANFGDDLYSGLVAPKLGASLQVESWRDGAGNIPSNCSLKYKVENIESINFKSLNPEFKTTTDHSKWAIGSHRPYVCIGDINRQKHQYRRGGGTNCINLPTVYKQFFSIVSKVENC